MVQGFRNDLSFLSRPQNFFLLLWSSWYCLQMTISLKWKKYGVWMQEFILCFRYLLFSIGRSNYRYHTAEKAHFLSSSSSSSSARMAPKFPNPRLKSNPRICYPLFTPRSKDSWSFLIPSFNIFAIRQNCMQLCPTVQYFYLIFESNWKFLWKFEFFEDLNFLNIWIFWKICFLKIWIFHLHKKIRTKFWIS